jgi:hypothetical protein
MPPFLQRLAAAALTRRGLTLLAGLGLLLALAVAIWAPLCMYYAGRMRVNDYGIYTNTLWNTAHGAWFRYLMDHSYLAVHLSFTLALLAPLFWLFDHPYLLAAVQSATLVGGTVLMARLLRRAGIGTLPASGLLLLFAGYPLIQQVVLCDFHGVCLYFILLPALYYTACYRRGLAWLPLVLILGLREDAGLTAIPLLAWLAGRERWKGGWLLTAAAVLYTTLACTVLYELINEVDLTGVPRRGHYFDLEGILNSFDADGLARRAKALGWLFLPGLPWLLRGRAGLPILLFPLLGLLPLLFSLDGRVHGLAVQYPAIVQVGVWLGIVDALRREGPLSAPRAAALQLYFLAVVLGATAVFGVGYADDRTIGWHRDAEGRHAEQIARRIPRTGTLLTTSSLCGYCSNRRDLQVHLRSPGQPATVDHLFVRMGDLAQSDRLRRFLDDEAFGVAYFDFTTVILSRGASRDQVYLVRAAAQHPNRALPFYRTLPDDAVNAYDPDCGWARVWPGAPSGQTGVVAAGRAVHLPAGRHLAFVRYRTDPTQAHAEITDRGRIELHPRGLEPLVIARDLDIGPASGDFFVLAFPFELPVATRVQPKILGGVVRLWLDQVVFLPAAEVEPPRPAVR